MKQLAALLTIFPVAIAASFVGEPWQTIVVVWYGVHLGLLLAFSS